MGIVDSWRLSRRFARSSGRRFGWRFVASSVLSFTATVTLFAAVSTAFALVHIHDVAQGRSWSFAESRSDASALVLGGIVEVLGESVSVDRIAPVNGKSPRFPGLDSLPVRGEYALSPALRDLLTDRDALALFPGEAVIGDDGVASAGELFAVHVVSPSQLAGPDEVPIIRYGTGAPRPPNSLPDVPLYPPLAGVLLLVVLPAILLLVVAAKLAATMREHRIRVFALLGAIRDARAVVAFEAILLGLPGVASAMVVWLIFWKDRTRVPFGPPVQPSSWQLSLAHLGVGALALVVLGLAAVAMCRVGRDGRQVPESGRMSGLRNVPLTVGVLAVIAVPWFDANVEAEILLGALILCAVGVVAVLPPWFAALGSWLRRSRSPVTGFLVGARFARFPRHSARGWAVLALSAAVFSPVAVWLNINALGDTDVVETAPPRVQAVVLQDVNTTQTRAALQDQGTSPTAVGVIERLASRKRVLAFAGSCEDTAKSLGVGQCRDLREAWRSLHPGSLSLSFGREVTEAKAADLVLLSDSTNGPWDAVQAVVADQPTATYREITPTILAPSPMVAWIIGGVMTAGALVLLAVAMLVVDRSMTARGENGLERIGLDLKRRRRIDAVAFAASFGLASAGGLAAGALLAVVMARSELLLFVPWQGLGLVTLGLLTFGLIGSVVVARGSNRPPAA